MNKKIELKDMLIDLVFAKNCKTKRINYRLKNDLFLRLTE